MKILLATDGSEFSFEAAKACCDMIKLNDDSTLKIISVIELVKPSDAFGTSDEYFAMTQKALRGVAEDMVEDMRRAMRRMLEGNDIDIETKAISGNPKETIVKEAEDWGADLIVVGSHGRGFWGRMLIGSVSNAVVRHAPCSVLVVRREISSE